MSVAPKREINLDFELWPKQLEAFESYATEGLYGGAAGGGKSHLERVESIVDCLSVPGLQFYLFRRNFQDLIKSYVKGPNGYQTMLGPLLHDPEVNTDIVAKEIRFHNGSTIYLCHCQHEHDVLKFGSFEFHVLNIAEAGEFTEFMINYLRSRVRMDAEFSAKLPKNYLLPKKVWRDPKIPEYKLPRIRLTANPVGPGKAYLEKNFVDVAKPGEIWRTSEEEGGMLRQFIPAKLKDNPSLNPAEYRAKLKGIGAKAYVDALLDGNWKVTIGAFFPQINKAKHLVKPFLIPDWWPRFMVMDWGACGEGDPFSIGWYTLAMDDVALESAFTGAKIYCARDSMICYRRWNGKGLPKVDAAFVADGIKDREGGEKIMFRIAGGDILEARGHGSTIFSIFKDKGITFRKADRRRQNGWAQVDYRLEGQNGWPLSFWFEECEDDLTTMSALQYHDLDKSDIAPHQDDHDADRHRYAAMTRKINVEPPAEERIDYRDKNRRLTVASLVDQVNKPRTPSYVSRG